MKRIHFSIRTLLLLIISSLNLLIAAPLGYLTYKSLQNYQSAQNVREVNETLYYLYNTKKFLSMERAAATSILFVDSGSFDVLNERIQVGRTSSQESFHKALTLLEKEDVIDLSSASDKVRKAFGSLQALRMRFDVFAEKEGSEQFSSSLADEYFVRITELCALIDNMIHAYSQPITVFAPDITKQFRLTRLIWEVSDYAGREYAILGRLIAQNTLPDAETRENLLILRGRIQYGLELAHGAINSSDRREEILPYLEEAETHYLMIFEQIKDVFYQPAEPAREIVYPMTIHMWLQFASEAVSSLYGMTDAVLKANALDVAQIERTAQRSIYLSIILFMAALILSVYTWRLIVLRVIRPVNGMVEALYNETRTSDETFSESDCLDEISKLEQVLQVFRTNSRQLQMERDKAQAASVAKSEFLANMSHEIRTPMNVVVGLSNILSRTQPLTEKQEKFIKTMQVSADSLLSLINDLLDFSKIEAQSFELDHVRFSMSQIVDDLILVQSFKAKEKGLWFNAEIEGIAGKEYMGDPTRIRQILLNLCSNALKFTEKGTVTLKINTVPEGNKEILHMNVSDTGIGITPDKIDTIFDKFTQADTSIVRKYGGTGLGLAIVKSLVEMMHGGIAVDSTPGMGTTFRVFIPLLLKAQQSAPSTLEPPSREEGAAPPAGRILVVEDYQPNAIVAGASLEQLGYKYDTAVNGHEAVQKFIEHEYDMILMDIQMPEMDGYQATRAIRNYEEERGGRRVKIIGLTAHASIADREKCISVGMDDYLSKPFNMGELQKKLEAA